MAYETSPNYEQWRCLGGIIGGIAQIYNCCFLAMAGHIERYLVDLITKYKKPAFVRRAFFMCARHGRILAWGRRKSALRPYGKLCIRPIMHSR